MRFQFIPRRLLGRRSDGLFAVEMFDGGAKAIVMAALLVGRALGSAPADDGKAAEAAGQFERAASLYLAAAQAGDAEAQYRLAGLYANGKGVGQDYAEALAWYRKAAEQGFENAQFNLAALYANGQGTRRDYGEAAKWWRLAGDAGHGPSQLQLSGLYEAGRGVSPSPMEAYKWCWLAAEQKQDANNNLARLAALLTPKQLATAQWLAEQYHDKIEEAKAAKRARLPKVQLVAAQPAPAPPPQAPAPAPEPAPRKEEPAPVPPAEKPAQPLPGSPIAQAEPQRESAPPPVVAVPGRRESPERLVTAALFAILLVPVLYLFTRSSGGKKAEASADPGVVISDIPVRRPAESAEDRKALTELLARPASLLGKDHYAQALRLCLRLGEFKTATELFVALQKQHPVGDAPELYYYFALFCEKKGDIERARGIYDMIAARFKAYKDVDTRMRRLDGIPPEEASRLTTRLSRQAAAPGQAAPPLSAGLLAGKFELLEPLGVGGMGVVYKGFDRALSREVAIKKMQAALAADENARAGFINEARVVAALNHPYIVSIHDIVSAGAEIYLVFEFVDGETLAEVLAARGTLAPGECARVLAFVCEALAYAHENGVVHRDLKPANLMMDRRGYVKVMDFGLAMRGASGDGNAAGTPAYMPPEQHKGRVDAQADVFALGATAYELLMGDIPFPGKDYYGQKMSGTYPPPAAGIPPAFSELIARCLKPDPQARPKGIAEVLASLRTIG